MKDWESTAQVLREKDRFEAMCSEALSNLSLPRQIYTVNTAGAFHDSIARKLKMASTAVTGNLSDVHSQVQNLRRDLERGFDQMEKRIDAQQQDLRSLTNSVSTLNDRVMSQSHSLLALQQSTILQERKSALENMLMHKSLMYNTLPPEERDQARLDMGDIQRQGKEIEKELERVRAAARGLAAPPLPPPRGNRERGEVQALAEQSTRPPVNPPSQNQSSSAEENQSQKPTTRSSARGVQNTRNAPTKRRKTGENLVVSSQEALCIDEDVDMVPESQQQVQFSPKFNTPHADVALRQVTRTSSARETAFVDNRYFSLVETCRRGVCMIFIAFRLIFTSMKNPFGLVAILIFLSIFLPGSAAAITGTNGLSIYALNANGMVNIGKLSQIANAVKTRRPHIQ